ncbi:hypothetical protein B484DRAFT_403479, partial [Ochromonadaceae sp. CCMP2298]
MSKVMSVLGQGARVVHPADEEEKKHAPSEYEERVADSANQYQQQLMHPQSRAGPSAHSQPAQGKNPESKQGYWKLDEGHEGDVVVIHVCDENQQISRDFCCKRDILVAHMKYFEKFLAENEHGYDDIDISVHCDVEIFEWLMSYINEPETPPK